MFDTNFNGINSTKCKIMIFIRNKIEVSTLKLILLNFGGTRKT
jgi:hypothetical protein